MAAYGEPPAAPRIFPLSLWKADRRVGTESGAGGRTVEGNCLVTRAESCAEGNPEAGRCDWVAAEPGMAR